MIPKIIHYVWVGTKPLPEQDRRRIESWRRILPNWEIRGWGNDEVDFSSRYLRQAYAVRAWNRVSDYMRMEALVRFGGVYLDTDVEIRRPLDPLLSLKAFLGFQIDDVSHNDLVNGAIFGAEMGHWLPRALRDHFNLKLDGRAEMGSFSGPGLLSQLLKEHGLRGYSDAPVTVADVTIFPRRYFYPYSWLEPFSEASITADTYTIHHWAESWGQSKRSLREKISRKCMKALGRYAPEVALKLSQASTRSNQLSKKAQ